MRLLLLASAIPLGGVTVAASPTAQHRRAAQAPVYVSGESSRLIEGQYIVKFKDTSSLEALDATASAAVPEGADYVYKRVMRGFSGRLDGDAVESLRSNPQVEWIEQDAVASINTIVDQADATWGLSRISSRSWSKSKSGAGSGGGGGGSGGGGGNGYDYEYDDSAGAGTCAYVIDTGILAGHADFEGRAFQIKTFYPDQETDGNGHGTHVAGTIGSRTYGVAKRTTLFGVKVLGDSGVGNYSTVIAGLEFAARDMQERRGRGGGDDGDGGDGGDGGDEVDCRNGFVAGMSLGGPFSASVNAAAAKLVAEGAFVAVAAGNSGVDAAQTSPASEGTVCTVGATSDEDAMAYFSNYGAAVKVFAPGVNITSLWLDGSTHVLSGTSMAAPHVVGLGAYLAGLTGLEGGGEAMCERIQAMATRGRISGVPDGTVNLLAFNGVLRLDLPYPLGE